MGTRIGGFIGVAHTASNLSASGIWDYDSQAYFNRQGILHWPAGESYGPIVATGGAITTPGNGYRYHFFTATGPFNIVSGFGQIDTYIVGGGGGGGFTPGGGAGGGAGGMRTVPQVDVSVGNYTVVCGAGSAGASQQNGATSNGSPSKITSALGVLVVEAQGGGGGAEGGHPVYTNAGKPGGSGGGGNYGGGAGGLGNRDPNNNPVPPQGNPGGTGYPTAPNYGGGGGGGAGGVGGNGANNGGPAGNGAHFTDPVINGLPQYGTPGPGSTVRYFAGGGGGGAYYSGGAAGAYGGGGNGGPPTPQPLEDRSGKANTGGGGGGMGHHSVGSSGPLQPAGNGGSGIVILRYQI